MKKLIEVSGTLRSAAYIDNAYRLPGDSVTIKAMVTDKKSLVAEVLELDEDSKKLVDKTIKELAASRTKEKVSTGRKPVAKNADNDKENKSLV